LLVALSWESQTSVCVHASFDLYLLVADGLGVRFAIKGNSLLLVADCFDAAVVKFFKGCGDDHLDGWHWGELGLVDTAKSATEERSFDFCAVFVADIVKSVIFQEVVVKNSIAILLVNVTSGVEAIGTFDSLSEHINSILVINGFPLD
jgi:hypothetical protein